MSEASPSFTDLQPLPANPVNQCIKAPSTIFDLRPSPLWVKPEEIPVYKKASAKADDTPTPPITPDHRKVSTKPYADSMVLNHLTTDTSSRGPGVESNVSEVLPFADLTMKPYLKRYALDNVQPLGDGAWSRVCRATEERYQFPLASNISDLVPIMTPPGSPESQWRLSNTVLAIKSPSRRDAVKVLMQEARILTYLYQYAAASKHIVAFHGWDVSRSSLVLTAYPQTLDQYIKGVDISLVGRSEPAIGKNAWVSLVQNLVSALAFLHGVNCVHGDIKPSNVLLSFDSADSIQPLLADFSSSHVIPSNDDTSLIPEVSATTTEYTSPELLAAMLTKNPERAVASFTNDVYGLGVTLLEAAAGEKPYANATAIMKLTMAKEGRVLDFMTGMSMRLGRGVKGLVGGACASKQENRWTAGNWAQVVAEGWKG